jgi:histidinol-phosphate phosphatase family protein
MRLEPPHSFVPHQRIDDRMAQRLPAKAVLFDRDGTLIVDVPLNTDPARVSAMPGASDALLRLRAAGIRTAVVSNQNAVAAGFLSVEDVEAINARMTDLLGSLGPIFTCMHARSDRCRCRKPAPGLLEDAARALDIPLHDCVMIGDIGSDIEAAKAAGARAVLIPTPLTRLEEVEAAPFVARTLHEAIDAVLAGAV